MNLRIATFNVENLDDVTGRRPTLAERIQVMRPQLIRMRADILCLQEVHSQGPSNDRNLNALDQLLAGTDYAGFHRSTTLTTELQLYNQRNLVTLSRFPISATDIVRDSSGPRPRYQMATADPEDVTANLLEWERPLLYNKIDVEPGRELHLINVHLKSKIASTIPGQKLGRFAWKSVAAWAEGTFISSMRRMGQALQSRLLIDGIFDTEGVDAWIAMCGDFNATAEEVPVKTVCGHVEDTGNAEHTPRVMVPCESMIPESSRYSLIHLGRGEMIDHVMASRGLIQNFRHAEIHNETLHDESGAFRRDAQFPESDHAPVIAEFAW